MPKEKEHSGNGVDGITREREGEEMGDGRPARMEGGHFAPYRKQVQVMKERRPMTIAVRKVL